MEDTIYEKYVKDIVNALRQISGFLYHTSREMKQRYGITSPQLQILKLIQEAEKPISAVEISRSLNVTPSNLTGMIDRLERMGLVERQRRMNDRRTFDIVATEQGATLAQKTIPLVEEKLIEGLKDLNKIEISSIYLALDKIIQIAGKEKVEEVTYDQFT